jgi:hypothetical protein
MELKLKTGNGVSDHTQKILPVCLEITVTADATVPTDKYTDFHSIIYYCLLDAQQEVELSHLCVLDQRLMYLPVMFSITSCIVLCSLQG